MVLAFKYSKKYRWFKLWCIQQTDNFLLYNDMINDYGTYLYFKKLIKREEI